MTVLAFERHPVDPAQTQAFEALVGALLDEMRRAPGNLWADAARAFDDDPSYLVTSEWRTEADAEAWQASGDAVGFAERSDPMLRGDVTRRRFVAAP